MIVADEKSRDVRPDESDEADRADEQNITLYPNGGVAGARASVARQRVGMRLPTPAALRRRYPLSAAIQTTVDAGRRQVQAILEQRDPRWLAIVGPCSIHDPQAALDYALHLARLADAVRDVFCVVMRVYFEKPRTTVGWKGLINDPRLDGSHRIDEGLATARRLLCEVNALGLPAAIEALDLVTPHYLGDLVSWAAIGARTTESQVHREMASGLPMPVGFKNGRLARRRLSGRAAYRRQSIRAPRAARRPRRPELRCRERRGGRARAAREPADDERRRRLLACELRQAACAAGRGARRRRRPDLRRQSLDSRRDAREFSRRRAAVARRRGRRAALRLLDHRSLSRLGRDRGGARRRARASRRSRCAALTRPRARCASIHRTNRSLMWCAVRRRGSR
ncbi:phospho-2-dehydro-3-deoxyheptonate aldolase [Burkholderia humptydooensis MSMB43]|uniref:3-deoxy-7-phosphoheptulonate synthase n=1 Tax=Burkholderia humptydooensis MSMB43 TaxID=441157 RepID=A0ABN0GA94_9BURK|nr:phospho-2-dehydro-3-deoxyheptonate aldolase [Burkholderia humptydooensis MSMB43]